MPSISFSFSVSALVPVLLILLAIAVSAFFYRHTVPPVSRGKRFLLISLRSLALALLFLFLFEPLLRLITTSEQQPVLAVLVDDSKSMTIKDRAGDRREQVKAIISRDNLERLAGRGEFRAFRFGTRTQDVPPDSLDSLSFHQDATDISAALRRVAGERARSNIGAALLVSDGSYNLGHNPLSEAEHLGLPLYTIGIGDSTEQRDVLITKVVTNERVYSETEVPVDVTIKSSGYAGENVAVTLHDGRRELARTTVRLQEGTREYAAQLAYAPEGEGVKKYTVRISQLPGELTAANNQRAFLARILKSKLRVLLLAGAPSPDVAIIKQTLREDPNIDVHGLTQKTPETFYERPLTTALLDSSDCLVLIGFPSSAASGRLLEQISTAVARRNIPLLFVHGRGIDQRKLATLAPLLPFVESAMSAVEQLVLIDPLPAQRHHPILATNTDEGPESWKRLPPLFRMQSAFKAKAEATVLATIKLNNIVLNEPLVAIRNVNRRKSLAVLGYGLWRWRLMAQGSPQTEKLLATFLANSIRWLTTRDDDRPVKVTPSKEAFSQGEPVEFVGQVYDASARPVENAQLRVVAKHEGRSFETILRPIGNGRYEGVLEGLVQGDYTFTAGATQDAQSLGEDRGRFSVGELDLEFQDTRMNAQLLRQLAARSGGAFFLPSQLQELRRALEALPSFTPRELRTTEEFELWNWKYMLALVVLLLAVEWFVRKRSGML